MYFSIFDGAANAVDTFSTEREAIDALATFVERDPRAADSLMLLRYDDDGNPVGEALEASVARPVFKDVSSSRAVMVAWPSARLMLESVGSGPRWGTNTYFV